MTVLLAACAAIAFAAAWLALMVVGPRLINRVGRIGPTRVDPRARLGGRAPMVTVVVAARDEQAAIGARIDNLYALDAPAGGLELLVISDGSTDQTDAIVRERQGRCPPDRTLVLVEQQPNIGKEAALGVAIGVARGDIIALSDATTEWQADVVVRLVDALLADGVGAASGLVRYRSASGGVAAAFDTYQRFVVAQRLAGRVRNIQVSTSGACSAIWAHPLRRYEPDLNSDLQLAVLAAEDGLSTAYVADAVAWEESRLTIAEELRARTRIIRLCLLSLPRLLVRLRRCGEWAVLLRLLTLKATRWLLWLPLLVGYGGVVALALAATGALASIAATVAAVAPALAALAALQLLRPLPLPPALARPLSGAGYALLGAVASAWAALQVLGGQRSMGWTPERAPDAPAARGGAGS